MTSIRGYNPDGWPTWTFKFKPDPWYIYSFYGKMNTFGYYRYCRYNECITFGSLPHYR